MDASLYEEHAELERDHWWFVGRRAIIEDVLARHLGPSSEERRILDVGCGTGGMLPLLGTFGSVLGLEAEPLALAHCRAEHGSFDVRPGSIPDDVPDRADLDLVTAFDVIEHLDDDIGALASFRSAIRPAGTIVITVPALPWLWSDHDRVNGHRRRYTRSSLLEALSAARLDVVHVSYFNSLLLPVVSVARLLQRLRRTTATPHSDFSMPPRWLNRVLTAALRGERRLVVGRGLPIGVSLVAVVRASADTPLSTVDERCADRYPSQA